MTNTTYPMEIHCAWCEKEGQPSLLRIEQAEGPGRVSHGICQKHFDELVEELWRTGERVINETGPDSGLLHNHI